MSNEIGSWFKWSSLGVTLLTAIVFGRPVEGQNTPPPIQVGGVAITGVPDDWSDRHIVFSDPGPEQEAIESGRHDQWQKIVNDPRYVMDQLKRNVRVRGPAADAESRSRWASEVTSTPTPRDTPERFGPPPEGFGADPSQPIRRPQIKTDWSVSLVGPGLKAGHYPAKYSFDPTTANCNDYVVFPTGVSTGTVTRATIVAFNNIYSGCPQSSPSPNPTIYWAYNTGGTANTSPVLSLDGSQIAFIQTSGGTGTTASLVILKMPPLGSSGNGSVGTPATIPPANIFTGSAGAAGYRACANGTGATPPCYITFSLGSADTNSAPFYRYDVTDTLYVGDDTGRLHSFTGIFNGMPTDDGFTPLESTGTPLPSLTSPVYDSASKLVFVSTTRTTDCVGSVSTCGRLYSVNTTTSPPTVSKSNPLDCGTGFLDPPLVDSSTENVYAFTGRGCPNASSTSSIYRFAAGTSIMNSFGQNRADFSFASANQNPPDLNTIGRVGAFDNLYFVGSTLGHVYACVNGRVFQVLMNPPTGLNGTGPPVTYDFFNNAVGNDNNNSTSACSPLTEFRGVKAGTTLAADLNGTSQSLTVASTDGMAINNFLQIDSEIMQISSPVTSQTVLSVSRAQLGTSAAAHTASTAVLNIQDLLFLSVQLNGNAGTCGSQSMTNPTQTSCVYNYDITNVGITGSRIGGLFASGGSSGIIIDNQSTTQVGGQQIYFSTLSNPSNAVQVSQSLLQ